MSKEAFDKIWEGLQEALAWVDDMRDSEVQVKPITLKVLREYFAAVEAGDVPDPALALYSYLLMDGFIPRQAAASDVRASLKSEGVLE